MPTQKGESVKPFFSMLLLVSFGAAAVAEEPQTEHRLGDHPAVIVKRLEAQKTYDYSAQFYPHPAWLWLASEPPRPMMDHPAVIIAKRLKQEAANAASEQSSLAAAAGVTSGR